MVSAAATDPGDHRLRPGSSRSGDRGEPGCPSSVVRRRGARQQESRLEEARVASLGRKGWGVGNWPLPVSALVAAVQNGGGECQSGGAREGGEAFPINALVGSGVGKRVGNPCERADAAAWLTTRPRAPVAGGTVAARRAGLEPDGCPAGAVRFVMTNQVRGRRRPSSRRRRWSVGLVVRSWRRCWSVGAEEGLVSRRGVGVASAGAGPQGTPRLRSLTEAARLSGARTGLEQDSRTAQNPNATRLRSQSPSGALRADLLSKVGVVV